MIAGAFVTGHSAIFEKGRELNAFTAATAVAAVPVAPTLPAGVTIASAPLVPAPVRVVPTPVPVVAAVQEFAGSPQAARIIPSAVTEVPARTTMVRFVPAAPQAEAGTIAPPLLSTVLAQRLAAARPVTGREPDLGWTISD